jgi:hypothetical protein
VEQAASEANDAAGTALNETSLSEKIANLCSRRAMELASLAHQAQIDPHWLDALIADKRVECDIEALCRIARTLDIDAPNFAGRAIEAILRRQ